MPCCRQYCTAQICHSMSRGDDSKGPPMLRMMLAACRVSDDFRRKRKCSCHTCSVLSGKSSLSMYGIDCTPGPYVCGMYTSREWSDSLIGLRLAPTRFSPSKNLGYMAAKAMSSSCVAPGFCPTPSTPISQRGHLRSTWFPSRTAASSQSVLCPIPQLAALGLFLRSIPTTFHCAHMRLPIDDHESRIVDSEIEREYHSASRECATSHTRRPCAAARLATVCSISTYETGWPEGLRRKGLSAALNPAAGTASSKSTCW
mmetsp:Transcript_8916/g.21400  ORF Transcript_8916/g.21400 Transcript_8916/m.21400 type:complete len:258 (+) Transcript_8916:1542-2315(+)